jgi:hypothetical protein
MTQFAESTINKSIPNLPSVKAIDEAELKLKHIDIGPGICSYFGFRGGDEFVTTP